MSTGIPQGLVFSLVLSNLFINGSEDEQYSGQVCRMVKSKVDCEELLEDLFKSEEQAIACQMQFSIHDDAHWKKKILNSRFMVSSSWKPQNNGKVVCRIIHWVVGLMALKANYL